MRTREDTAPPAAGITGRFLVLFLLACTLLRIAVSALTPLLGAEAYYWEWSQHLDWGYFDHPPMVAVLMFLATRAGTDSVLSVKLVAIIAGLLTTGLLYLLARDMFGRAVAATACCILQVLPFFAAVNLLTIPDTPLALFWMLSLLCVYRATCAGRPAYWYAAGLALGLALQSKYHAFLLFPCVLLFLALSRDMRVWLRRKEPYLAAAIALIVFSPNLVWNLTRGMRTFQFLLSERHGGIVIEPAGLAVFAGGMLVMLSPLIAVLVVRLAPQLVRRALAGADNRYLLLVCTSLPILGFFALLSPLISVGAHWPAVGYPALMLAAVAALCDPPRPGGPSLRGRFARAGIGLSLVLVLAAHCVPVVVSVLPPVLQIGSRSVSLASSRLYEELQGWEELGRAVVETVAAMPDPERTFVVTRSYRLASQIRFLSGSAVLTRTTGHADSHQYLIWNRQSDLSGWDAIFIDKNDRERYREELQGLFERVGPFETIPVRHGGDVVRTFYLVRCHGLRAGAFDEDA